MYRRFAVSALIAAVVISLAPMPLSAASKEIMELQRDVAGLQEQLRILKESQDKQLTALTVLVQQALDNSSKSNTGVAVIQSNLQQTLKDMEAKVVAPVAGLAARMDSVDQDLRTTQQSLSDLTATLNKMQQQLVDLNHAVSVLQAPAPPPPAPAPSGGGAAAGGGVPGLANAANGAKPAAAIPEDAPCPPAGQLYPDANSDRSGKKYDAALHEYAEYLRCYGNLPLAPNAQFYIGTIHAAQGDYETAVKDFDVVLEKYPDNSKTADALYEKGMALVKLDRRTDGASEFAELIRRYPKNDLAAKACDQRKALGYNCPAPRAAAPTTKKRANKD